jgi:hypothetical protein
MLTDSATRCRAFERHFRRLYFGYRMLPFYKNAHSSATVRIQELLVQGIWIMTSGIDHFARLTTNLKHFAARQPKSQGLKDLAAALMRFPAHSNQRLAYNSVMDHAAVLNLGASIEEVEHDHIEEYRLNDTGTGDPQPFLERLIADIDSLVDDAELNAGKDLADDFLEEDGVMTPRANEIARGIACKKAEDGAREAAEEAYRLAYQWAYEDIFEEAYHQALSQLAEPGDVPR